MSVLRACASHDSVIHVRSGTYAVPLRLRRMSQHERRPASMPVAECRALPDGRSRSMMNVMDRFGNHPGYFRWRTGARSAPRILREPGCGRPTIEAFPILFAHRLSFVEHTTNLVIHAHFKLSSRSGLLCYNCRSIQQQTHSKHVWQGGKGGKGGKEARPPRPRRRAVALQPPGSSSRLAVFTAS